MITSLNQKVVPITPPGAIVDNTSWTTAAIDTKGWDYMTVYVMLGATDIAMAALTLGNSDTDGSYAVIASFATAPNTLPDDEADNTVVAVHVDLRDKKRYFDLTATAGNGTLGTYLTAWAVLSRGENTPSSATERGLGQEIIV